jgi:ADP-heptose:LPS heptosyltransferase
MLVRLKTHGLQWRKCMGLELGAQGMHGQQKVILVHLSSGIGNIILGTTLLLALNRLGFVIDVLLSADYPQTGELLSDWSVVRAVYDESRRPPTLATYDFILPAIPPFYWSRFASQYQQQPQAVPRPPDALFYHNEQEYYLSFARQLGLPADFRTTYRLPIAPNESFGVIGDTLVIAPGCKAGEMAAKRWQYFPQLAEHFSDVAVVGTADDLQQLDGMPMIFPPHCKMFVGSLSLRETAELIAAAGVVVANDSGLGHLAAAVGAQTIMLFGPTPDKTLGPMPQNITILRAGLICEPCWFNARFKACVSHIDCLRQIPVDRVVAAIKNVSFTN